MIAALSRLVSIESKYFAAATSADHQPDYWTWGSPKLDAFDFSLVVRGGSEGFACYVRGNNQIWLPSGVTSGYTDGKSVPQLMVFRHIGSLMFVAAALAEFLVLHGEMLSPKLLLKVTC